MSFGCGLQCEIRKMEIPKFFIIFLRLDRYRHQGRSVDHTNVWVLGLQGISFVYPKDQFSQSSDS